MLPTAMSRTPATGHAPGNVSEAELLRVWHAIVAGQDTRGPGALATVVGRSGSAPQRLGARLLRLHAGDVLGTVGGGAVEGRVLELCAQVLRTARPARWQANLIRDLGMCCGGTMEVFVEYVQAQPRLFVIGAGHVAQALAPVARTAGFAVTVCDDREDLLGDAAFAEADTKNYDVDELATLWPSLTPRDYVVIVTRDHARDEQALVGALGHPHAYIGMIGSKRKVLAVLGRVQHRHGAQDLSRVHAPVGLDLGGRTPGEIAVAIAAELIAHRHEKTGQKLSIVQYLSSQS